MTNPGGPYPTWSGGSDDFSGDLSKWLIREDEAVTSTPYLENGLFVFPEISGALFLNMPIEEYQLHELHHTSVYVNIESWGEIVILMGISYYSGESTAPGLPIDPAVKPGLYFTVDDMLDPDNDPALGDMEVINSAKWLRVDHVNGALTISAYISSNGTDWTHVGEQIIDHSVPSGPNVRGELSVMGVNGTSLKSFNIPPGAAPPEPPKEEDNKMADFVKGREEYAVHGKRNILRSAQPGSYTVISKTVSHAAYPEAEDADGNLDKVLQEGEVLAVITSGDHAGKVVPYQVDATDGQGDLANLVGVTKDYFGWELTERDVEAGVLVRGQLVQAWCTIRDADGKRVALTDTVADALRGKKNLDILFF